MNNKVFCSISFVFLRTALFFLPLESFYVNAQHSASFVANGRVIKTDSFNKAVNNMMRHVGVPGLSLAVIDRDKIVFFNAYGVKDLVTKEKINKETIFEACSLSKTFLVLAALRLASEGRLDIDKPLYQYMEYSLLKHDERYKKITARMVLSHSSCIENWKADGNSDTLEILSEPGSKYVYSGEGYQYLAKVIASIVHAPYDQYIEELVFKPLQLRRTFSRYIRDGSYPTNYAIGHDVFGRKLKKEKNLSTVPASGVHTTAFDYATLIISIFSTKYLSQQIIKELLTPAVRMDSSLSKFYGPGFHLMFNDRDTIVSHGGNNPGFKGEVMYSPVKRCGLVFLSNGDLGKLISKRLAEISTGLTVDGLYHGDFYEQYPCNGLALFSTYRQHGEQAMFSKLEALKLKTNGRIGMNTLNQLADILASGGKIQIAKKLAEENVKLYPESAQTYYLLGAISMYLKNYKAAYIHFRKAKDLRYDDPEIEYNLKVCLEMTGEN